MNTMWLENLVSSLEDSNVAATCSTQTPPDLQKRRLTTWEKMIYAKQGTHQAFNDKSDAYKKAVLNEIGFFDEQTYRTACEAELNPPRLTNTTAQKPKKSNYAHLYILEIRVFQYFHRLGDVDFHKNNKDVKAGSVLEDILFLKKLK